MTYISLPPNTVLSEAEFIHFKNKAIQCCAEYGYAAGMVVVHIGSGYELLVDGNAVKNSISAPMLSRSAKLVNGN